MGVALSSDPTLYRRMVQNPLLLQEEFSLFEVEDVEWVEDTTSSNKHADVFRCHYEEDTPVSWLHLGIYWKGENSTWDEGVLRLRFKSGAEQRSPVKVIGVGQNQELAFETMENEMTVLAKRRLFFAREQDSEHKLEFMIGFAGKT